jgi:hypothetical protein
MSKLFFKQLLTNATTLDDYIIADADLQVSENSHISQQTQVSHTNEGMTATEPVTAGTSQHERVCTMSQRMAESMSQQKFYRDQGMHNMCVLVCVFLASGYGLGAVMHEITISSPPS